MGMTVEDTPEDRRAREGLVDRLVRSDRCERESTADALRAVPRHAFVDAEQRRGAYEDRPLPIGDGQTISAPHMVAAMLDLLALSPGERVLEIGTGCGYHAAVTAEVVGAEHVYSIEVSSTLSASARERLDALGYRAVSLTVGDGRRGWPEFAPYDAIYLTCATADVPDALIEQLGPGGRLLAPVGRFRQKLIRIVKAADGSTRRDSHGGVRFVPMRRR